MSRRFTTLPDANKVLRDVIADPSVNLSSEVLEEFLTYADKAVLVMDVIGKDRPGREIAGILAAIFAALIACSDEKDLDCHFEVFEGLTLIHLKLAEMADRHGG